MKRAMRERGFTLIEMLVTIGIVSLLFGGLLQQYSSSIAAARDHSIRMEAQVQAQALAQTIVSELRSLGNGVPFDQSNFEIAELALTDPTVTEPILVTQCTESRVAFRLNETGEVHLLAADFDPSFLLQVQLTGVDGLDVNDPIYISNAVMSGDEGLYATIAAVDSSTNTVTLNGDYITTAGATFDMGSTFEEVPVVVYESLADGTGITRDSGFGPVIMANSASMELEYLDWNLNVLALPLTNTDVINSLRAIRVTINVDGKRQLSTGENFTATVTQIAGLRNLNFLY